MSNPEQVFARQADMVVAHKQIKLELDAAAMASQKAFSAAEYVVKQLGDTNFVQQPPGIQSSNNHASGDPFQSAHDPWTSFNGIG